MREWLKKRKVAPNKLYTFRDIEGNPNTEVIAALREIADQLGKREWFIGVSVRGSSTQDDADFTRGSDVDITVFADFTRAARIVRTLENDVRARLESIGREKKLKIELRRVELVTPAALCTEVQMSLDEIPIPGHVRSQIALLSHVGVGEKLYALRDAIRNILSSATPAFRQKLYEEAAIDLARDDVLSFPKRVGKMDIKGALHMHKERYRNTRQRLWVRRLRLLWEPRDKTVENE